ncbi:MotA/TolQ/ExbB proton channel family protein [Vibrio alginolyticus]|jgi:biopolymer transport protein ExbB|uniref:MotA/TolQ/ExbB proton channel family protein n=1 Tax=Vibrio alginolyticus TaxID=663 RepID=UPI0001BDEC83|nr:MotA/TolQ/ExbB proton channel family protein [Vibrio alginolyticus]EEZ83013.1 biopolymer transport protein ExbB-related protein [Vibrio alginolyticus 40B]EGR0721849.1 flagellar motor protein MotA [Vibrio alginolyticus]EIO9261862.1 MotA/TolQ/ExbB proton channel family protein [Vibrio alginolyticus]EJE3285520.1 MotA/TolQ/ExbB proton channel family protein [Vibrio alginolyticus]EJN3359722.1 MotA/TolQ/ExbB proton channel family protein [Vibrio alginolyticus]
MMKKWLSVALISTAVLMPHTIFASDALLQKAQQENRQQQSHNVARESGFKQTEQELQAIKNKLAAERAALQAEADSLSVTFGENEAELAQLEEKLRLETGSLGELFGVVRQNAKELESELKSSVTGVDANSYQKDIDAIVAAKSLPTLTQLQAMWRSMEEQIKASGEMANVSFTLLNGEGREQTVNGVRLGSMALLDETGYVKWNGQRGDAVNYLRQPENGPTANTISSGDIDALVIDPSRGILLEQLANSPTLADRLNAGGVVGKIILGLLAIGLLIALVRGASLMISRQKIMKQLKTPAQPGNNPLGRVLAVYQKDKHRSVEALELRLLEAVVDEQTHLEKGLSMLKLLAALAPMLGLLGTVTGMIETFQVITQFGNGDPKVMAGGISMALVTTVLGLVSAMPLLLAHNVLSSQAENIRSILEKQGIGLVAEQAERDMPSNKSHSNTLAENAA